MTTDDPARLREQATYYRQQAAVAFDAKTKKAWLELANDALKLAEEAERRSPGK